MPQAGVRNTLRKTTLCVTKMVFSSILFDSDPREWSIFRAPGPPRSIDPRRKSPVFSPVFESGVLSLNCISKSFLTTPRFALGSKPRPRPRIARLAHYHCQTARNLSRKGGSCTEHLATQERLRGRVQFSSLSAGVSPGHLDPVRAFRDQFLAYLAGEFHALISRA